MASSTRMAAAASLLAGVVAAVPFPGADKPGAQIPHLRGLELWERANTTNGCQYLLPDGDTDAQRAIWDSSGLGVGQFLDDWLTANGEEDWLTRMDEDLYTEGVASGLACVTVGSEDCQGPTPDECVDYEAKGVAQWYWIVRMAVTHYGIQNALYQAYQTEAIEDTLRLDNVIDLFGNDGVEEQFDALSMLVGLFGMAGAVAGPAAPIFGVLGGAIVFGRAFEQDEEEDFSDVQAALLQVFDSAVNGISSTLHLANQGTDPAGKGVVSDLPNNGAPYASQITNYFDGGRFLVTDVTSTVQPTIDLFTQLARQAMVIQAMKHSNGHVLVLDGGIAEADCAGRGNGRAWIDDGVSMICATLMSMTNDWSMTMQDAGNDLMTAMAEDDYGAVDYATAWTSAVQCARNGGSGNVDPNAVLSEGLDTNCFYNYPVLKTTGLRNCRDTEYGPDYDFDDPLDTTGRDHFDSC